MSWYCFQLTDHLGLESFMFQQMLAGGTATHKIKHESKKKKTKYFLRKDLRKWC